MAHYSKQETNAGHSSEQAMDMAKANQRPGQSKEQTKLIAQGIKKGIEQYKKQHKAKLRAMDKERKKTHRADEEPLVSQDLVRETRHAKQSWLAWALLVISWLGFVSYLLLG